MKRRKAQHPAKSQPPPQHRAPRELPQITEPVSIEKPIYGGAFLARVEGKAIFVPLALPGEQARIRITDDKGAYATAEPEQIVTAAPERVTPACPHFGACGGCHYQHANYTAQLDFKQAILRETLTRSGVTAPEEISVLAAPNESQSWAYRNRIRLAFDADGNPGYRGRHSHTILSISECPIAAPLLVSSTGVFAEAARELSPSLRPTELSLFTNADQTAMLATVITASTAPNHFEKFASAVAERIPTLKGVDLISQPPRDKKSASRPRTIARWGDPSIQYHAAGFDYHVDHGAFFQVNRWLVDGLVENVCADYHGHLAWDLFAGVGLFARQLTTRFEQAVAVESAPPAVASLEDNLRGTNSVAVRASTLDFLRNNSAPKTASPDLIILDPPRTGLGPQITTLLAAIGAPAIVYVSCDPATLARDLRPLLAYGYAIHSLTLADLFPHTFHLETVVHLRRA